MKKIYISYRRGDSRPEAKKIWKILSDEFGDENVLFDVSNLSSYTKFYTQLEIALQVCHILLVIIGPDWMTIRDERGNLKIRNYGDYVQIEIRSFLFSQNKKILPVLVGGATMPAQSDLPTTLQGLETMQPFTISAGSDFEKNLSELVKIVFSL
jgi:hypothetical protein